MSKDKDPYHAIVVNMFGGPGTGKSTLASSLYSELKWKGVSCEFVPEFVKGKIYDESWIELEHQHHVFGNQLHQVKRCSKDVNVVVLDTSLLNSLFYKTEKTSSSFKSSVLEEFRKFKTVNFFVERTDSIYDTVGREQSLEEAQEIDRLVLGKLKLHDVPHTKIVSKPNQVQEMLARIDVKMQNERSLNNAVWNLDS